jgi:hypothetical protein
LWYVPCGRAVRWVESRLSQAQNPMPPESSHTRCPAAEGARLSWVASRALSACSGGTPTSGTGTAMSSSRILLASLRLGPPPAVSLPVRVVLSRP